MTSKKSASGATPAALPRNEEERLAALRSYDILDTPEEQVYNDFVLMASAICQTPIALMSLVDRDRQWLKARVGLPVAETSREVAFCAHAILETRPLVVKDALEDHRFATNPLVSGDPHIRFYAGVPLITANGHALGTICAIDRTPRDVTAEQTRALQALSRRIIDQLELRRTIKQMRETLGTTDDSPLSRSQTAAARARAVMEDSEMMRQRIRDLLGRLETIQPPKK